MAFYFSKKKKKNLLGLVGNLKKIPFFRSNNLFLYNYLKVDFYGSLSRQGTNRKKKLKTSRIKAKIIYFEASNYGKKSQKY